MKKEDFTFDGGRLKSLRENNNISFQKIAEATNISITEISNYENNRNVPGISDLVTLADFYCVSVDYILGRSNVVELPDKKPAATGKIEDLDIENLHLPYQTYRSLMRRHNSDVNLRTVGDIFQAYANGDLWFTHNDWRVLLNRLNKCAPEKVDEFSVWYLVSSRLAYRELCNAGLYTIGEVREAIENGQIYNANLTEDHLIMVINSFVDLTGRKYNEFR